MEIRTITVSDGLVKGLSYLLQHGLESESRNGTVLRSPEPVLITHRFPKNRVLFSAKRNANPFFHLMESVWMLAGRCDVAFPVRFNKRFVEYSDNGATFNGAYGFRWRHHFSRDQLNDAVEMLKNDPTSRRVVVAMWDAEHDLMSPSLDIPCNTHIYFEVLGGTLNMTVCNRSNDVLWGAFGANAVHMSIMQEYLANRLNIEVGLYRQFTNNLHLYTGVLGRMQAMEMSIDLDNSDLYREMDLAENHTPVLSTDEETWNNDLETFMAYGWNAQFTDPFFAKLCAPVLESWETRRLASLYNIEDDDWRTACIEWVARAEEKKGKA